MIWKKYRYCLKLTISIKKCVTLMANQGNNLDIRRGFLDQDAANSKERMKRTGDKIQRKHQQH